MPRHLATFPSNLTRLPNKQHHTHTTARRSPHPQDHSSSMAEYDVTDQAGVLVGTATVTLLTGFVLGIYAARGYLIPPSFAAERRKNLATEVESEESDVDEDDSILDHAPNWANGEDADRRDGLRARKPAAKPVRPAAPAAPAAAPAAPAPSSSSAPTPHFDANEECKLVLVVRTDLGMTKGKLQRRPQLRATFQEIKELTSRRKF